MAFTLSPVCIPAFSAGESPVNPPTIGESRGDQPILALRRISIPELSIIIEFPARSISRLRFSEGKICPSAL